MLVPAALFAITVLVTLLMAKTATAQTPQPTASAAGLAPGFLLVLGRATDRAKLGVYSAALPPIYAQHGGAYIGAGRAGAGVRCVYGLCEGRSAVVARFAQHESVAAFWWGDNYRHAVRLRDAAGAFTVVSIQGAAEAVPEPGSALLMATLAGSGLHASASAWLVAATAAQGRLLSVLSAGAVQPLEGDAAFNQVVLLSFSNRAQRDAFAASPATAAFIQNAPPLTLLAVIAVDAPLRPSTSP